jgi:ectoine hydroxylase-related dioxygenase (phytanoyl-CoA dioxygenase family)
LSASQFKIVETAIDSVEQHGFAIIPDVFDTQEITSLLSQFEQMALPRDRAGSRHLMANSEVAAFARHDRLVTIAESVLGADAWPFRATFFDKSSGTNWLVPWHQDTALPLQSRRDTPGWGPWSVKEGVTYAHAPTRALNQILALRIHLDDSTEQNGPLRVLPGTHNQGVLTDDEVEQLAKQSSPTACLVPKGGVILMRPLVIHASSKSHTEARRRVLHIEYASHDKIGDGLHLAVA